MSPHLSQLNIAMAHVGNFRRNNLQIQIGNIYKDWSIAILGDSFDV